MRGRGRKIEAGKDKEREKEEKRANYLTLKSHEANQRNAIFFYSCLVLSVLVAWYSTSVLNISSKGDKYHILQRAVDLTTATRIGIRESYIIIYYYMSKK